METPVMARSLKHTRNFKYTKHNKVFDNIEAEVNARELSREVAKLRAGKEHVEIQSPRVFEQTKTTKDRHGNVIAKASRTCYSLTWYTRKDLGAKVAA